MKNADKKEMGDVTFLIPVRIDTVVRLENLLESIYHIQKYFDTNIFVLEANVYNNGILERILPSGIKYQFIKDEDPIFHRTKYLNFMAKTVCSCILSIWDADIIVPHTQIVNAVDLIRKNMCEVSFPYDGCFFDTTPILRNIFLENHSIDFLIDNKEKMLLPYGTNMGGGAIFIDTKSYKNAGGENEKFYGWGPEDWERIERWKKFGYRICRVEGGLFHLSHPRDLNGMHNSKIQRQNSMMELHRTMTSSLSNLKSALDVDNSVK